MKKKNQQTIANRKKIGFPTNRNEWRDLPASFGDHRLEIMGHAVMEDWEAGYMKRLSEVAVSKAGRVLEVGFGMGIAASFIEEHDVEEHVVIEANAEVFERLKEFGRARPRVTPLFGFWEEVTPTLAGESFSSILFDTYPLTSEEIHRNHFPFFSEAYRLLKKGGVLTYYSDEEEDFSPEHLAALRRAGFSDIQKDFCPVKPPSTCAYWQSDTILVPIVFK